MKTLIDDKLLHAILTDIFAQEGIQIKFVDYKNTEDKVLWDKFLEQIEYVPFKYTWEDLQYQFCYVQDFVEHILNLSMLFVVDNNIVGVWPVSLIKKEIYNVCTNQGHLLAPLYFDNKKMRNKINNCCLNCISAVFVFLQKNSLDYNNKVICEHDFSPIMQNRTWYEKQMLLGGRCWAGEELYVDLSKTYVDIHENIRKSYRSLINFGYKNWQIKVYREIDEPLFNRLKDMHIEVAGRKTRSDASWSLQYDAVNNKTSFIAVIEDENKIIGWALFGLSRDECYYGVGVFDRTMFDKPISHFLQDCVIKYLKANTDIKWYYLGHRFYKGDYSPPSEKELNISYFKEGFCTDKFIKILTETVF